MLSLDFICEHPDVVRAGLEKRQETQNIDEILRFAEQRRGLNTRNDGLHAALKNVRETLRATSIKERALLNEQQRVLT